MCLSTMFYASIEQVEKAKATEVSKQGNTKIALPKTLALSLIQV